MFGSWDWIFRILTCRWQTQNILGTFLLRFHKMAGVRHEKLTYINKKGRVCGKKRLMTKSAAYPELFSEAAVEEHATMIKAMQKVALESLLIGYPLKKCKKIQVKVDMSKYIPEIFIKLLNGSTLKIIIPQVRP